MSATSICFTGLSRAEEAEIVGHFKQANARLGNRWLVAPESEAAVLVIDMDSMYGQMSLMKALGTGKVLVALTAGSRADTDHLLQRPVDAGAIEALLRRIEAGAAQDVPVSARVTAELPAAPAVPAPAAATPAPAPAPAPPAPVPPETPPAAAVPAPPATVAPVAAAPMNDPAGGLPEAAAPAAPARPRLADLLRPGALPGPVELRVGDAPPLLLDPATQTWSGGSALKPLLPYTTVEFEPADLHPVPAAELPARVAALGTAQPFQRLAWLAALGGSGGALLPGFGANEKYKLLKWPQTEREWPKHFRIATVMMKGPALLSDVAEQSGVALPEVIEFVNACLAVGVAEPEVAPAATPDPKGGGGLLGRFRR